jgi:hypothetical protein
MKQLTTIILICLAMMILNFVILIVTKLLMVYPILLLTNGFIFVFLIYCLFLLFFKKI